MAKVLIIAMAAVPRLGEFNAQNILKLMLAGEAEPRLDEFNMQILANTALAFAKTS